MTLKQRKLVLVWIICLVVNCLILYVLPREYSTIIIMVWLAIGIVIGNSLLDNAVCWVDAKYCKTIKYRKMNLYNATIVVSINPIVKAGVTDELDVKRYQQDYRIAVMYGAMFWFTGLVYGIISVVFRLG